MPTLDFFAAPDDAAALFDFVFANTDLRVFELYSAYGEELKQFASVAELQHNYRLGEDARGNGGAIYLNLWSPSVMPLFPLERITLNPASCNGHTFRYTLSGSSLIQIFLGGVHDRCVTKSIYKHYSEKGARQRANDLGKGSDWAALAQISNKLQYHIRKRMAVAVTRACPVLPQAYSLAHQGYTLQEFASASWQYELPEFDT